MIPVPLLKACISWTVFCIPFVAVSKSFAWTHPIYKHPLHNFQRNYRFTNFQLEPSKMKSWNPKPWRFKKQILICVSHVFGEDWVNLGVKNLLLLVLDSFRRFLQGILIRRKCTARRPNTTRWGVLFVAPQGSTGQWYSWNFRSILKDQIHYKAMCGYVYIYILVSIYIYLYHICELRSHTTACL